jgi:hypothetical protein
MAKQHAGDWRDWDRIRAWADQTADAIAMAPRPAAAPLVRPARWTPGALGLLICGAALLAWLAGEVAVLRSVHVLQLGYLAVAVVMLAVALHRRAHPLATRLQ